MALAPTSDWSFARRPFWLFSHLFALAVVSLFVVLGLWQLSRHNEQAAFNRDLEARADPPAASIGDALDTAAAGSVDDVDYQLVTATGRFVGDEIVRVANRSQGGVAGQHVVALFELDDGRLVLVNRGFVPQNNDSIEVDPAPVGEVAITGWLRTTVEQGWLGAADTGEGTVVPRLDVSAIASRLDAATAGRVVDVWLLLDGGDNQGLARFPDPVGLPPRDAGPHLGYMGQWFVFAALGVIVYGLLLRRTASGRQRRAPTEEAPGPLVDQPRTDEVAHG